MEADDYVMQRVGVSYSLFVYNLNWYSMLYSHE